MEQFLIEIPQCDVLEKGLCVYKENIILTDSSEYVDIES